MTRKEYRRLKKARVRVIERYVRDISEYVSPANIKVSQLILQAVA